MISRILEKQDRMAEFLRGAIQNDMNTVMSRSDMVVVPWLRKPRSRLL